MAGLSVRERVELEKKKKKKRKAWKETTTTRFPFGIAVEYFRLFFFSCYFLCACKVVWKNSDAATETGAGGSGWNT